MVSQRPHCNPHQDPTPPLVSPQAVNERQLAAISAKLKESDWAIQGIVEICKSLDFSILSVHSFYYLPYITLPYRPPK